MPSWMSNDYIGRLRETFQTLTNDFQRIWQRDYEEDIERYKKRLEKGAVDIASFLYSIPEIRELDSYQSLVTLVGEKPNVRDSAIGFKYSGIQDSMLDYLLVSATNNQPNYDSLFSKQGFESAFQLLLEDSTLEVKPNRGVALLYGVKLGFSIFDFSEDIRLRRATRFEIRSLEAQASMKRLFVPVRIAEPFHCGIVVSGYFLEYNSDDPFSFHEVDELLGEFLSAIRLTWGYDIGVYWSFCNPNEGNMRPEFLISRFDEPERKKLETKHVSRISDFWNTFRLFRNSLSPTTQKYFNKALMRFNRSFLERDPEDALVDLAISLEILTSGAKSMTSFLLAPFIAYSDILEEIENVIAEFDRIRNRIVHGSVSGVEREDLGKWVVIGRKIVSACLRNFTYYATKIPDDEKPEGKRGIRNTLDACAVSLTRRMWLWKNIPVWSMIRKAPDDSLA